MKRDFSDRHIGTSAAEITKMLGSIGVDSIDELIAKTIPQKLRDSNQAITTAPLSETETIATLKTIASKNVVATSLIGQGYYGSITPTVIARNVLENPAWYTAYTPYQAEISQGRLEALANFQKLIMDLTGMPYANASLLDEATAIAEAALMSIRNCRKKHNRLLVDANLFAQSKAVLITRANSLNIELDFQVLNANLNANLVIADKYSGVIIQNPDCYGGSSDYSELIAECKNYKITTTMVCDPMSLVLLKAPAEMGVDIVVGCSQRFGVPMGFGGPHAAFMACSDKLKRTMPGRIVGLSKDKLGNPAYRLALQTREQHIRREKATSNICTAQALLAIIASFYAVYHGADGLKAIATKIHQSCVTIAKSLQQAGYKLVSNQFFDTLTIELTEQQILAIKQKAKLQNINLFYRADSISLSVDESTDSATIANLLQCFDIDLNAIIERSRNAVDLDAVLHKNLLRTDKILTHKNFNNYQSETNLLRYMRKLADKDIALDRSMIPLGSCTMKLNATTEMLAITWEEFANIHPFAPADQTQGYAQLIDELEQDLSELTGYHSVSLQPNAGSQGEYAGLLAIMAYHKANGQDSRNLCLIPASAHGTNPASAALCGMQTKTINCDNQGNIDIADLKQAIQEFGDSIAAIMVTYPSTHGVFEENITEVCDLVHSCGGQVYIDGANLNAMIGICQPGKFGGDVSHLNLHKTFCIPHGGGGPGVGPIGVAQHLKDYLPGHPYNATDSIVGAVAAAPYGSAGILPITWAYIKLMGKHIKQATEIAILNSNYVAAKLAAYYPILYTGKNGFTAHECIIDCRQFKASANIEVEDIAKRLIDYGFHAPTMSFPVAGTLMIEPTESESLAELNRFCKAMQMIYKEIAAIEAGKYDKDNNPLKNAPHPAHSLMQEDLAISYTRSIAAYPIPELKRDKYWVPVARVDNAYGDKNLFCGCS